LDGFDVPVMSTHEDWGLYTKTGCFCFGVCAVLLTFDRLLTPWIRDVMLRWAVTLSVIQVVAAISITIYLLGQRAYARFQRSIHDQMRPAIQERVMALALAGERWSTAVPKHGASRYVLEQCLANALSGLKESGRDRIARFAVDQGFAKQWEKTLESGTLDERKRAISLLGLVSNVNGSATVRLAVHDKQPAIRVEAARALLISGDPQILDAIFRSMLRESLLVRVLLSGDLKRHARYLLASTIPSVLDEETNPDIIHCLEILTMWRLAIPALNIASLLARHQDPLILPLLVTLLPYVSVEDSIDDVLLSALRNMDLEVQCAAARAAGQLKLTRLIPALVPFVYQNVRLAIASATALAQMGIEGVRNLETIVRGADRKAASVAMEALETLTIGTP
jgi:hypothetical protein